jgi:hypothetical protein
VKTAVVEVHAPHRSTAGAGASKES